VSPSFFRPSAGWDPEKAVAVLLLHVVGLKIKSHDFPFRVDRIDLGLLVIAARVGHVNRREDEAIVQHKAVHGAIGAADRSLLRWARCY
jgi:hypothetical protein